MGAWEALVTGAAWDPFLLPLAVAAAGWLGCVIALWLVARTSSRADSDVGQWLVKFLRLPLQLLADPQTRTPLLRILARPDMAATTAQILGQPESLRRLPALLADGPLRDALLPLLARPASAHLLRRLLATGPQRPTALLPELKIKCGTCQLQFSSPSNSSSITRW